MWPSAGARYTGKGYRSAGFEQIGVITEEIRVIGMTEDSGMAQGGICVSV